MSWIAVMVGVGVGATAGGVSAGLNGGSTEDILKSMAIGGAMGGAGGGIGGAVFGGAGGAAAGGAGGAASGGAAGGVSGGAAGGVSGGAAGGTGGALGASGTAALNSALPSSIGLVGSGGAGAAGGASGGTLGASGTAALNSALPSSVGLVGSGGGGAIGGGAGGATSGGALAPVQSALPAPSHSMTPMDSEVFAAKNLAANEAESSWGSQLLSKAGLADAGTVGNKIGGQALESSVYGAGINGLLAGMQGQDVGKAMGRGALTGGIGGAAAGGLGEMGGAVGDFATAHPMLTSGGIGLAAGMGLDSLAAQGTEIPTSPGFKSNYRFNPNTYRAYLPRGNGFGAYAAGGITDLDNYDAASNQPTVSMPGTLNIPNRAEVANNEGYVGDAVQMMAGGGVANESYRLEGVGSRNLHREASQDLRDYLEQTPNSELTPEQIKQKLTLFGNGMAHGGISDLGGYSDGGRLLKGPGDGVSDDIPASIGGKQPARLAEGEFVVPARIVSELGNGSTDAGAKRLYQMMDRIQSDRKKTMGKGRFSDNPKAYKHLPA